MKPGETEFLYLTTTGRRTGQPREIEIWFTEDAGRYYVIAEHGEGARWAKKYGWGAGLVVELSPSEA